MKNSNEIQNIFKRLEQGESNDLSGKENVWNKLEQKLDKKEKKTKVVPIWKISGIAASFVVVATAIYFFTKENEESIQGQSLPSITKSEDVTKNDKIPNQIISVEKQHDSVEIKPETKEKSTQNKETFIIKSEESGQQESINTEEKIVLENPIIQEIKPKEEINLAEVNVEANAEPKKNFPTIQGVILDSDGFPVSDAEVAIRGGNLTVVSDEDGKFDIDARIGDVLKITDAFGTSQDYAVYKTNMGTLELGTVELETVTVMSSVYNPKGKRKQHKRESTNTSGIVSIRSNDYSTDYYKIEKKPSTSIDQMLAGKISGLNSVGQAGGAPGGVANVVVRGSSSLATGMEPLYLIDGIVISEDALKLIDTNKIKSVNVLKGASATAVYGSRATNGVVIITTKKGLSKRIKRKIEKQAKKKGNEIDLEVIDVEVSNEEYSSFVENKFENPSINPLSTFSVDVDKASYSNIRRMLNNGQTVPKDAVRIEEMINYFYYNYPQPTGNHPFSINTEYSDAPWNPGHQLLKIGLQGKNLPVESLPNSNLVFLVDVSGSMNDENKLPLLKKSLELLVNNLRENDKVSIVVYAGAAGVVLPPTSGTDKTTILNALNNLSAGGSTAGAAGIELAYQLAQGNFIKGGNNRVILATDGDFNVGSSSVGDLETLIEDKRKSGIFLTCLGYGMGNYKDNRMETLANKGNGNYAYIDNLQEANKFLVREFSGTLYTIAKDVKIQIEFNPNLVQSYRLIGYETRLLNDEDFVNDAIDAGEIGAGHQVTALYEIIPNGTQSNYAQSNQELKYSNYSSNNAHQNELATVKFRYKKPDGDKSTEIVQPILNKSVPLKEASEDFKFATDVAWFGLKLRDSEYIEIKDKEKIIELGKDAMKNDKEGYKSEFLRLVELVK